MAKIPFDITYRPQIESGEYKVETDCKEPVTIIKWDLKNDNGNILCYYFDGKEDVPYVTEGKDLFIVTSEPEPELTEFENELATVIGFAISQSVVGPNENTFKFVKIWSERLLDLARKEFIKQGYVIEKKTFHDAVENISDKHYAEMSVEYSSYCKVENGVRRAVMNWDTFQKVAQKFIDIGKAEALKDLPRWYFIRNYKYSQKSFEKTFYNDTIGQLFHKGMKLYIDDLEKLPGFKED